MIIEEKLDKFLDLIYDQISYGGKKYALTVGRESTDEIFDVAGYKWLLGTLLKYRYRYMNLARERDILKIAAYCYIIWLKRGFFIREEGISDVLDTDIELKNKYFSTFSNIIKEYHKIYKIDLDKVTDKMETASAIIKAWIYNGWDNVKQKILNEVFCLMFYEWNKKYSNIQKYNTDTWNEKEK